MREARKFCVSVCAFSLLLAGSFIYVTASVRVWAQAVASAQISGEITDPSGSAVPGATVTATQTETRFVRSTVSGVNGAYVMPNLPIGPYVLEVTASGFASYTQR